MGAEVDALGEFDTNSSNYSVDVGGLDGHVGMLERMANNSVEDRVSMLEGRVRVLERFFNHEPMDVDNSSSHDSLDMAGLDMGDRVSMLEDRVGMLETQANNSFG